MLDVWCIFRIFYIISKLMKFVGSQSENRNDNTFYLPKTLHAHHLSWFIFRVFFYEVPFAPSSKTAPRSSLLFLLLETFLRHQSPPISPRLGIKASKPWWKRRPPSGVGITPPRYMCIKCRSKHIRKHHLNWKKGSWFLPFPVFSSIFIFVRSSSPGKKTHLRTLKTHQRVASKKDLRSALLLFPMRLAECPIHHLAISCFAVVWNM